MLADLFEWNKMSYLLIVDSRFIEIVRNRTTADEVINHTKRLSLGTGFQKRVQTMTPNFLLNFCRVACMYQFTHITSSPYYPQSSRKAERAVGIVKQLLKTEWILSL